MASPDEWFLQTLQAFQAGTLERYKVFDLGLSPDLGVKRLARATMIMPQSVMRKALERHQIPIETLHPLPILLRRPIRVLRSKSDENTHIFQLSVALYGESIVVAAEYARHKDFGLIHLIKSVHPRPFHQIKLWIDEGLLIYSTVKEKSQISPQDSAQCNSGQQAA
jgi:hypothetical protein